MCEVIVPILASLFSYSSTHICIHLVNMLSFCLQADIKEWQTQLLEQLLGCIQRTPGPPVRRLIGRCLAALFSVGDTFMLFDTVNKCNDLLKNRDDSPTYLPTRLLVEI